MCTLTRVKRHDKTKVYRRCTLFGNHQITAKQSVAAANLIEQHYVSPHSLEKTQFIEN